MAFGDWDRYKLPILMDELHIQHCKNSESVRTVPNNISDEDLR